MDEYGELYWQDIISDRTIFIWLHGVKPRGKLEEDCNIIHGNLGWCNPESHEESDSLVVRVFVWAPGSLPVGLLERK